MRLILVFFGLLLAGSLYAQRKEDHVREMITELASDAYLGRASGTPHSDKAAAYIASQFSKAGLKTFAGAPDFLQKFQMVRSKTLSAQADVDGKSVDTSDIIVLADEVSIDWKSGSVESSWVPKGGQLGQRVFGASNGNKIIFADTSFRRQLQRLRSFGMQRMGGNGSVVVILTPQNPTNFSIKAKSSLISRQYQNVVGIIEGKRKEEFVVFSSHYDHLGVGKPVDGDSIFNGANDDASGTTAVMALAGHYAKMKKQPERSLLFVAFTAEEAGGFGSTYFSNKLPPEKVVAMFNIEMIGTETYYVVNTQSECYSPPALISITISPCTLVIPTAFTPDFDGTNDWWEIPDIENYPNHVVSVYNRWGNLLYKSEKGNYTAKPWDGKYDDRPLPVASYYFIIDLDSLVESDELLKGTVSIVLPE